jgi:hypothetical protein
LLESDHQHVRSIIDIGSAELRTARTPTPSTRVSKDRAELRQ